MRTRPYLKLIISISIIAAFLMPQFLVLAQDSDSDVQEELSAAQEELSVAQEERETLEAELKKLEEEIAKAGFQVKEDADGNIIIVKKST